VPASSTQLRVVIERVSLVCGMGDADTVDAPSRGHGDCMHRPFPIVVLYVTLAACRHSAPADTPTPAPVPAAPPSAPPAASVDNSSSAFIREYRGAYSRGFEASWFAPCDQPMDDALWWVTLTDEALHQRDSLIRTIKSPPTGALAVRWRGTTSRRMPAGQMGRGTRYILVTQVLDVRPLSSIGACFPMSRTS
jgi:hypothetical protein